jgi:ADP-ribosyl-[dinitrogen reductase] hydrolase
MAHQTEPDSRVLDRFQGCLLGAAIGDALGAPVEFCTQYEVQKRHGLLKDMVGGGWLHLEPGQWTDDTAQTLALAESYVAKRTLDLEDFTHRLLKWFSGNPPDVGNQTRQVLEYLRQYPTRSVIASRKFWYNSGGTLAGNGSLMRCAPTALFRCNDVERLIQESILASQVTHFDPRCTEACLVVNFLIAQSLHGNYTADFHQLALAFLRSVHQMPVYHQTAVNYEASKIEAAGAVGMEIPYRDDMDAVERVLKGLSDLTQASLRSTGYAVDTLQAALYIFRHAGSFSEGLITAVNLGGDADTLGAVTGALLGSRFGRSQIPPDWLKTVAESARIRDLAELLLKLASSSRTDKSPGQPTSQAD